MRRGVLAVAVVVMACKGGSRAAPQPETKAEHGPMVRLVVDGEPAGEVAVADLAARPTLASVIGERAPVATWRQLEARGDAGPTMHATRLDETYRDQDAILYLDAGRPALGMFRRVAPDATATIRALAANPTGALAGIVEIRVRTTAEPLPEASPIQLELAAGERKCTLDAAALATIAPAQRGRGGGDRAGWDVRALARACFGAPPTAVHAPGLDVDAATLARADRMVIAKINRRGVLKLRLVEPVATGRPRVLAEVSPFRIDVDL